MTNETGAKQNEELLARLKRHDGVSHPYLCKMLPEEGGLKFIWMTHASFGAVSYTEPTEAQSLAAADLLESGQLVPTKTHESSNGIRTQYLSLAENVRWGLDKDNEFVIFEMTRFEGILPDTIIRPDAAHDTALRILKGRLQEKQIAPAAETLSLSDGTLVTPLIQSARFPILAHIIE